MKIFNTKGLFSRMIRLLSPKTSASSVLDKIDQGLLTRPEFSYGVLFAALQAKALGYKSISVFEFGVSWGHGILELEKIALEVEKETGILIEVYGFDTGEGLPKPKDYRDLPYVWQEGFFRMDVEKLQAKLTKAKLIIGDVKHTVPEFLSKQKHARIGFASIDVDFYSSTKDVLKIFRAKQEQLLPRVYCYFDDIIGDDWEIHCEFVGQLLAIKEYNSRNKKRKICKISSFYAKRKIEESWNDQMYVHHTFNHSDYNKYINKKPSWESKRLGVA